MSEPKTNKKRILIVGYAPAAELGEESFSDYLRHTYGENISLVETYNFETAAKELVPLFDEDKAQVEMSQIRLPAGYKFEIVKSRFGHHIHVMHEKSGDRLSMRDHLEIGFSIEAIERHNQMAPFDTMITEELIHLMNAPRSPKTFLGLSLVTLAQMAKVPRIGIRIAKSEHALRHFMSDIRCGEKRLVLSFEPRDWPHVARELMGI